MGATIKNILAQEILSSDGSPTIEATVTLDNGITAVASVPFGISAGVHEAKMILDNDPQRYNGKGMLKSCNNVNNIIAPKLKGSVVTNQKRIDKIMIDLDGTKNKSKLGGNSILAVSLACARAASLAKGLPLYKYIRQYYKIPHKKWILPKPMMVVIEGGKHADQSTDFQEYLMSVLGAPNIREAVRWGEETYQSLKIILNARGLNTNVGNEGAFAPGGIISNEEPLSIIVEAIEKAGFEPGRDIAISLDPATSELYDAKEGTYILKRESAQLSSSQMVGLFKSWLTKYPIISIEDALAEDDWEGWQALYRELGDKVRIVGDDLTVTSKERVKKAIDRQAINAVLIKLNQIGTLTETVETIALGQEHNFWQIVSHRGGGETNDTFLVDLAVAVNAEYIKVGPTRGERTAKYNRLMAIESELKLK
ncbi:phosphopyruvate hydratase [Patescibacteria group bacterium]|nr:phosphopyruvate hydratase [Patescibacteria group bacterium]